MKEIELYPILKNFFLNQNKKVYAEVLIKESSRYVDVIVIDEESKEITAIELKTSYNQQVIKQALFNANSFHKSYIAIPRPLKKTKMNFNKYIGVIFIDLETQSLEVVHEPQKPAFLPSYDQMRLRLYLNSINEIVLAGEEITKNHLTGKQITLAKIINFLHQNSPISLKELESKVESHLKNHHQGLLRLCHEAPEIEVYEEKSEIYLKLKDEKLQNN